MMDYDAVKALFLRALELPAPDREAFLQQECGGDVALLARVLALLRQADGAMIGEAGGPETYLRTAAAEKPRWVKFRHYPTPMKLALEMVLFEEGERAALEGELEELENAWREAEDLAAISDNLIQPKNWAGEKARLEAMESPEGAGGSVSDSEGDGS